MPSQEEPPKAILFDIGGVCVLSPFRAILDYELNNSIPPGYINYAISRSSPNGYWHRLERGEIPMDSQFFAGFGADLMDLESWTSYHQRLRHQSPPSSTLETAWTNSTPIPALPRIDASGLFWNMMSHSRTPDPHIFPALKRLKSSGKFVIAALSNTVIFPDGHPYNFVGPDDVRNMFDVFVSSAHVGMRKPDPRIYHYALEKVREVWRERSRGEEEIEAKDIVFLDDIGENLKTGRAVGMRTIRVVMGRTEDAVRELERVTGMPLLEKEAEEQTTRIAKL